MVASKSCESILKKVQPTPVELVFVESVFTIQCYLVKYTLLCTAFSIKIFFLCSELTVSLVFLFQAFTASTPDEITNTLQAMRKADGPNLLEIKVRPGSRKNLGRPTRSPVQNKGDFMHFLAIEQRVLTVFLLHSSLARYGV